MEFWIGLTVGMHLGKVVAGHLEKLLGALGVLSAEILAEIEEIEEVEAEAGAIIGEVVK